MITAATRRTLPLRRFTLGHTLVRSDVVRRHGVPDQARFGPFATAVWSAAIARAEPALLVPAARAVLAGPSLPARGDVRQAVAAARAGAWTRTEGLQEVGRSLRRRV